jgi:ribosomal protein S18 acetylase RimI-like enzyme
MNLVISPFTLDAYEKVMTLWKESEGIGLSGADSKESIRFYLERNPDMSLVAKDANGTLVGAALCGHDGRRGYIHHLAVRSDHRRQGIGRRLVEECLSRLQAAGIQKCHLFIFGHNASGIEFWKSLGWTPRTDIGVISKDIL